MLYRIASAVRVSRASSLAFATVGTTVTTLVVVPGLSILFTVLLGRDLGAPSLVRTGYAAALVALALSVCAGVVGKVATDRNLGVFQEVHLRRRVDVGYWVSSCVMPALLSVLTAAVVIVAVFFLSGAADGVLLGRVIVLGVLSVVIGALMGIGCAGLGVGLPDPYLGATIASALIPLTSGVLVSTAYYPDWARTASRAFPMTGVLQYLDGAASTWPLVRDMAWALVLAGLGIAATGWAVRRLRDGRRLESI